MADPVRDFLGDDDGDLAVENGDFGVATGEVAVEQGIDCRLRTWLGEIYLDEDQGVDWPGQILVKNPNPVVVDALLKEAIGDTPDVTNVVGAQLRKVSGRDYVVNYTTEASIGSAPISGSTAVGT